MKMFVVTNKDINDILNMSTDSDLNRDLFKSIIKSHGQSLTTYIYNIMTTYLVNYTPISEYFLGSLEHNNIYDRFEPIISNVDMCHSDVLLVDHIDAVISNAIANQNNDIHSSVCSSIYEDFYHELEDHYTETYGSRFLMDHHAAMLEDLERVVENICFAVKEIESRYLNYSDETAKSSNVLFGLKEDKLIIVVD